MVQSAWAGGEAVCNETNGGKKRVESRRRGKPDTATSPSTAISQQTRDSCEEPDFRGKEKQRVSL